MAVRSDGSEEGSEEELPILIGFAFVSFSLGFGLMGTMDDPSDGSEEELPIYSACIFEGLFETFMVSRGLRASAAARAWFSVNWSVSMSLLLSISASVDKFAMHEVSGVWPAICLASACLSSSISSWASLSLSLVLFVVLAAVDIDIPDDCGPLISFCLSLSSWAESNSNWVVTGAGAFSAFSLAWAAASMTSSESNCRW